MKCKDVFVCWNHGLKDLKSATVTLEAWFYFQINPTINYKSDVLLYTRRDHCVCCQLKAVFLQDPCQQKLHFHLCKPQPDAVPRAGSKWQIQVGVTWTLHFRGKSLWIVFFWVVPDCGIPMNTVYWDEDESSFWNHQVFHLTVLCTRAKEKRN